MYACMYVFVGDHASCERCPLKSIHNIHKHLQRAARLSLSIGRYIPTYSLLLCQQQLQQQ